MEAIDKVIQQFRLQVQSIEGVMDSFSSDVYKVTLTRGATVYVKIPFSHLKLLREVDALHILNGKVPVPALLDVWYGDGELPGALLLSEVEGEAICGPVSRRLAYDIGVIHARMHEISPPNNLELKGMRNEFDGWSAFFRQQFYSFAEDVQKVIPTELYEQALTHFEKMHPHLPEPEGPSFVHMDFRPANIIVLEDKVSGIIDFESVRFAATEVDFTKINRDIFLQNEGTLASYQDGYNSVRPLIDLDQILPFYRFCDAFNSIGWSQRRGLEKNRRFYEENLELLKSLL
ncbi:phosphotransferase family protein [Alkalihalobacillus pseudalcaliphilus]|uniref:phosphotransferase family protein n=1 Tax=Alkalihalobacillus pseudalcaliphilus TaxID=79884 RepID=UPI00064DAE30|nr:aminoglycoside phosphotransferase family protein [Alkalihalobacillus pseudalcaliphilus]KMK76827.1 phosphotransferase [Alkalihalobacillus pseudalcaliphilus]